MSIISRFLPSFFSAVDPQKNQENAELSIKKDGFHSQKDYGMKTREDRIKLLQFVITSIESKNFRAVCEIRKYIEKHQIFNDIDLACFAAKKNPLLLIEIIDMLQISEEVDRYKLIELVLENLPKVNLPTLIMHLNKFNISTISNLKNIIDLFIRENNVSALIISFDKLGLTSDEDRHEIAHHIGNAFPKKLAQLFRYIKISNPIYIKKLIAFLINKSPKEMLHYFDGFHADIEYRHNIARMLLADFKSQNLNDRDNPFQGIIAALITRIEKYRNEDLQTFLTIHFLANVHDSPNYLKIFHSLSSNKKAEPIQHLLLPMVIISSLVKSENDLSIANNITKLLSLGKIRKSLRSSTGFMQNLLHTLCVKEKDFESPHSSKKLYSIYQALYFSGDSEKECRKSLDILSSLFCRVDTFKEILDKLPKQYPFEELITEFNNRLPNILCLQTPIDNFFDKYTNFENKMRVPSTLIKYITRLEELKDDSLSKDIEKLVRSTLENQVRQERYSVHDNPHLKLIKQEFPSLFSKWVINLEPQKINIDAKKQVIAVDTDDMQDLFLCGTEITGSCQRIDLDPNFTKGLMAYVLDGKNKMLAIKDIETGKIRARCLLKLLLDDKTREPVLFQEKIYPGKSQYTNQLNDLAKRKANNLNLPLYSRNLNEGDLNSPVQKIISLANSLAYEYVDGMYGIVKNGKVEISASRVG